MTKPKSHFACQACGYQTPRWLGRCPDCGTWGSLIEEREPRGEALRGGREERGPYAKPQPITEIEEEAESRFSTGITELDRPLGGGVVLGSFVLIGGDPGIGKSTLLLQASANISRSGRSVLYVSGEESLEQTRSRGKRLGAWSPDLYIASETCLEAILEQVEIIKPQVLVIDSVQTTYSEALESAPGSIGQVREVANRLMHLAKGRGISTFIVGHVTKDGSLAGPRALEHIVDTVIYFEGERQHFYRILRATKNRFGSTDEIGVFEMTEAGLREVPNPSQVFLEERPLGTAGSVILATVEGTRPLLLELQALVAPSLLAVPRRTAMGVDYNRMSLLLAVLEKRMGLRLGTCDVYLNVAGGLRVFEPAADLAMVAALISSSRNLPVDSGTVLFGEVGLSGEVRAVRHVEKRLHEASRLGYCRLILPRGNRERLRETLNLELIGVRSVEELLESLFPIKN
ncbi:MAG: DNA repair protein RadA [candidate division NC10 bacterium]|nr:DNA repair protein RadA [candidate division NC10 bacterium]